MGGRTIEAMALLGLGFRRLSITPAAIGPVKSMIRSLELAPLESETQALLASGAVRTVRPFMLQWAADHNVEVG